MSVVYATNLPVHLYLSVSAVPGQIRPDNIRKLHAVQYTNTTNPWLQHEVFHRLLLDGQDRDTSTVRDVLRSEFVKWRNTQKGIKLFCRRIRIEVAVAC